MRSISQGSFNGPLDLLLHLIEQEELDISQISLAKVTEEYIAQLQKLEELPADELADFLVVAAKLLVIKSRLMVPGQADAEDVATDLEQQLRMYQAFVEAAKLVAKRWNQHRVSWPRDGYANLDPIFNPPEHLTVQDLHGLFAGVLEELEPIIKLPQTVMIRTINIRQKIEQVKAFLLKQRQTRFSDLLRQAETRTEAIITFLAVLELVKQRSAIVEQSERFGDVQIQALTREPLSS